MKKVLSDSVKPIFFVKMFLLAISILTLDIFRSVRFAYSHIISRLPDISLNAFYYTLKTDAYDHSVWNDVTVPKAVRAVPGSLEDQPLFLSIDDTMAEKSGKHFELCSKLYDHAAHNGSNYLNGHCMVSLLLSFPVYRDGKPLYLSVPVGYRLWDKEKGKLALAADLVTQAMKAIGQIGLKELINRRILSKPIFESFYTDEYMARILG